MGGSEGGVRCVNDHFGWKITAEVWEISLTLHPMTPCEAEIKGSLGKTQVLLVLQVTERRRLVASLPTSINNKYPSTSSHQPFLVHQQLQAVPRSSSLIDTATPSKATATTTAPATPHLSFSTRHYHQHIGTSEHARQPSYHHALLTARKTRSRNTRPDLWVSLEFRLPTQAPSKDAAVC